MGVISRVLQNEQRAVFFLPKLYSYFIEKEYIILNFVLEKTQDSISSC